MLFETDRMIIRDFTMADAADLYEILGDAETMENCEPAYDMDKITQFLRDFCIDRHGGLAAVHKASGKVIGYILFNEFDEAVYEIGWFFNKAYWRQGYAYESCKAVLDYGFQAKGAHKLFAEAADGAKSVGLMKKLGMQLEGIQREQTQNNSGNWVDLYFYGILRSEWAAMQQ